MISGPNGNGHGLPVDPPNYEEVDLHAETGERMPVICDEWRLLAWDKRAWLVAAVTIPGRTLVAISNAAGIEHARALYWLRNDPEFSKAYEQAQELKAQEAEAEAYHRAVRGTRKVIVSGGKVVMIACRQDDPEAIENPDGGWHKPLIEVKYSDRLMVEFLRARVPAFARNHPNRVEIDQSTTNVLVTGPERHKQIADGLRRLGLDREPEAHEKDQGPQVEDPGRPPQPEDGNGH